MVVRLLWEQIVPVRFRVLRQWGCPTVRGTVAARREVGRVQFPVPRHLRQIKEKDAHEHPFGVLSSMQAQAAPIERGEQAFDGLDAVLAMGLDEVMNIIGNFDFEKSQYNVWRFVCFPPVLARLVQVVDVDRRQLNQRLLLSFGVQHGKQDRFHIDLADKRVKEPIEVYCHFLILSIFPFGADSVYNTVYEKSRYHWWGNREFHALVWLERVPD